VLKADIADFYARIYHHRLENRLFEVSTQPVFVRALMKLLEAWNGRVSYGIPIGQAASRLLAELVLDDIDRNLMDEGFIHCRWIDDYRLFCKSDREAHRAESFLTKALSESHGLSLQQSKTMVVSKYAFQAELEGQQTVRIAVHARTREILDDDADDVVEVDEDFGDLDEYERVSLAPMEYEELPANIKSFVSRFSIDEVLRHLIRRTDPNLGVARVLIAKLRSDKDARGSGIILEHLELLNPILPDAIGYLIDIQDELEEQVRKSIGKKCIDLLKDSELRDSEYSTLWLLWLFAESSTFDNESSFASLYNEFPSQEARRKIILALGNAQNAAWFRMRRNDLAALPQWNRRAFLYGARCLLPDERDHWYKSIKSQLDELDIAVVEYAKTVSGQK
jgi:hypothetical protein